MFLPSTVNGQAKGSRTEARNPGEHNLQDMCETSRFGYSLLAPRDLENGLENPRSDSPSSVPPPTTTTTNRKLLLADSAIALSWD